MGENIISYPKPADYRLNYEKGMRFDVPEKGSEQYRFFMKKYGTDDPNEILERVLIISEITGEHVDMSDWNNFTFRMYLPKDLMNKYAEEPIE